MKKATIILLSMLLVLLIGQTAFAKGNISLTIGYDNSQRHEYDYYDDDEWYNSVYSDNGFKINLSGYYYITDKISLSCNMGISSMHSHELYDYASDSEFSEEYDSKYVRVDLSLFGRYEILNLDIFDLGIQLGVSNSMQIAEGYYSPEAERMSLAISVGAYGNIHATQKLDIYTDLKFPIIAFADDIDMSFFGAFLYDITLGATYEIYPNINLGLEGNINNSNVLGIVTALYKIEDKKDNNTNDINTFFAFSIGAKVGYKF